MRGSRAVLLPTLIRASALAVLGALLLPAGAAHAAVIPMSVEAMARGSKSVVVARVAAVTSRMSTSSGSAMPYIVTDVDLIVERRVSGTVPSTLRVTVPGGMVAGLVMDVDEAARFSPGERVLLFVDKRGTVVADRQGKLDVDGTRVRGLGQSLSTVETRVRKAVAPPTNDPWYLAVQELVASAPEPLSSVAAAGGVSVTSITPSLQSAGTTSSVTLSGTGFGSVEGTVTFYERPSSVLPAKVTSWSDTSIVCEVPSGASSGPVTVETGAGTASLTYAVGFSYSKMRRKAPSISYRINSNCADPGADEVGEILPAMATWNAQSAFRYAYGGPASTTQNPPPTTDSRNDIYWSSSGFESAGTLAWNTRWYYLSDPGTIVESDIVFNDAYDWGDASVDPDVFDIETVVLHELGHTLSLDDQYGGADSGKTMYGWSGTGSVRRTLSLEDVKGIDFIYGAATLAGATTFNSGSSVANTQTIGVSSAWTGAAQMRLDPGTGSFGAWMPYAPALTLTLPASEGTHTVRAEYRSALGVTASTQPTAAVLLDLTPPTTNAVVLPTYTSVAVIDISSHDELSGVAKVEYRLDGVEASGTAVSVSVIGPHTLQHRATDRAGNVSAWSPLQSFAVVEAPPAAPSDARVSEGAPAPSVLVRWADNAVNESAYVIERSLDSGPFVQVASLAANTTAWTDQLDGFTAMQKWGGRWAYRIKATNSGGGSGYATSDPFVMDVTAPSMTSDAVSTYYASATIAITADDRQSGVATVEYELDGAVAEGTTVSSTDLGSHVLRLRATDRVGNVGSWTAPLTFVILHTPPTPVTGLTAAAAETSAPGIVLSWTDSANETDYIVERAISGSPFAEVGTLAPDTTTWSDALDGVDPSEQWGASWVYRVTATNTGGSEQAVSEPLRLDSLAPTATADVKALYYTNASISIVATDGPGSGVATVEYRLDGQPGTGAVVSTSAVGTHVVQYRAVDIAGNAGDWSDPQTFAVQPLPWPTYASIGRSASRIRYRRSVSLSGYVTPTIGGGVVLQVRRPSTRRYVSVASVPFYAASGTTGYWTRSYRPTRRGTHYFRVRAINPDGSLGVVSRTTSVYVR